MTVYVYQTFSLKQDKFKEGLENLRELKKFSNENYSNTKKDKKSSTKPLLINIIIFFPMHLNAD